MRRYALTPRDPQCFNILPYVHVRARTSAHFSIILTCVVQLCLINCSQSCTTQGTCRLCLLFAQQDMYASIILADLQPVIFILQFWCTVTQDIHVYIS